MTSKTSEFLRSARAAGIRTRALSAELSAAYADCLARRFPAASLKNHPQIDGAETVLDTERHEFRFSLGLPPAPAYIVFPQGSEIKERVIAIANARKLSEILSDCYGMEYAVSDRCGSYLVCVNWYSINITGRAAAFFYRT